MKEEIKKLEKEVEEYKTAFENESDSFIESTKKFGLKIKSERLEDLKKLQKIEETLNNYKN